MLKNYNHIKNFCVFLYFKIMKLNKQQTKLI